jgi:hypothetical protein
VALQGKIKVGDAVVFRDRAAIVRLIVGSTYVVSRINEGGSMEATRDELRLLGA